MAFQRKEATILVDGINFAEPIELRVELWDITREMQMCIKAKGVRYAHRACGIEIKKFGKDCIVHSVTGGICGEFLLDFVENYFHYRVDSIYPKIDKIEKIILRNDDLDGRRNRTLKIEGIDCGFKDIQED